MFVFTGKMSPPCSVTLKVQRSVTECRLDTSFGCASCSHSNEVCGAALWVEKGCRGIFSCGGRDVACGQPGDVVGLGRRRCECWFDSPPRLDVLINMTNGGAPKQGVFNIAFSWNTASRTWWGLGRYMQGSGHLGQCWRRSTRVENHTHYLYLSHDAERARSHENYRRFSVPSNAMCDNVGEPKWVSEQSVGGLVGARDAASARRLVYCYTNGKCDTEHGWPSELPPGKRRDVFLRSQFGNYLFALPTVTRPAAAAESSADAPVAERTAEATLLSYTSPPDPSDPSAKNLLFFELNGRPHVLALIEPHVVYEVGAHRVHARVAAMHTPHVTNAAFGFGSHLRLSLSGGPVRVDERTFLVAAHIAAGGWWNAQRLTFFYAFDASPPFRARCATPPMGFGLSRTTPPLEYATHMELHERSLYVSVGVDNCWSALVRLPADEIMARCRPLPLHGA